MEKHLYCKGDEFFSSGRRYSIISCIRAEGYREVYKLERRSDSQAFLMKILNIRNMPASMVLNGKPRIIRYLDTSNIARQLSVFDWGVIDEDHYYIISRYFTKGLLSDRIRQGSIKLHTAINIVLDLAETLSSLQAYDPVTMNICPLRHGDVCPNNIMYDFDEKGDYKTYLIDIEHMSHIAEDKHDAAFTTESSCIDLRYCAPEILIDEPAYNSDVFSLGVILYECAFGEYPFPDGQMSDTPEYLKMKHVEGVAGRLIHLVSGMLEQDPSKRINIAAVITHLKPLRAAIQRNNVEMTDEKCFDESITSEVRIISNDHTEIYTLDKERREKVFLSDLGELEPENEIIDDFLKDSPDIEKEEKKEEEITNQELGYSPLVKRHDKNARGFKDVAGMDDLKELVRKKVLFFLNNPELAAEYKINTPNGMLLYGPPGCGKTFFAEKFAEESGFSFALIKASDLGSTWVHGTQGKINELFKEAKEKAPCVLCFDEFDAFAPDRSNLSNQNLSGEVNEFLSQLNNCGKHKIFIIATTNNPEGIDPAILRSGRLEHKVYIPIPDFEARKAVLKHGILSRPCTDSIDFDRLAEMTEGYVTSDLSLIVNDAAMNAAYARAAITHDMLEEAIRSYKPSVSEKVIREHEEIRRRMESDKTTQTRIGFK